jgi:hypothetical protein
MKRLSICTHLKKLKAKSRIQGAAKKKYYAKVVVCRKTASDSTHLVASQKLNQS